MMKFRVNDHYGSGNLNESQNTASSTVNLTSKYLGSYNKNRRRNSLVVEDTGRLNTRRNSVPDDSFITIDGFKYVHISYLLRTYLLFSKSTFVFSAGAMSLS